MSRKKKRPAGRPAGRPDGLSPVGVQLEISHPMHSAGDPLDLVADLGKQRRSIEAQVVVAVASARRGGATWAQLGRALGVTPQAVQKRYGGSRG